MAVLRCVPAGNLCPFLLGLRLDSDHAQTDSTFTTTFIEITKISFLIRLPCRVIGKDHISFFEMQIPKQDENVAFPMIPGLSPEEARIPLPAELWQLLLTGGSLKVSETNSQTFPFNQDVSKAVAYVA